MKTDFTFLKFRQILFMGLALLSALAVNGQTKYVVQSSNYVFTPAQITINVGDTVEWTNVEGYHNVNGAQSVYSSNPESFGNDLGYGWTYSHVFTTAGVDNYRCDAHFTIGMVGKVTVNEVTSSVGENPADAVQIQLYPNPTGDIINIQAPFFQRGGLTVDIYNLSGLKVAESFFGTGSNTYKLNISGLEPGIYLVKLKAEGTNRVLKFRKQ